ncbi:MAG: hypothetical protein H6679_00965 [Epsilonproteobacteria bacterium]|nr:hypothetical protein [Campylobacterota bacterium]
MIIRCIFSALVFFATISQLNAAEARTVNFGDITVSQVNGTTSFKINANAKKFDVPTGIILGKEIKGAVISSDEKCVLIFTEQEAVVWSLEHLLADGDTTKCIRTTKLNITDAYFTKGSSQIGINYGSGKKSMTSKTVKIKQSSLSE